MGFSFKEAFNINTSLRKQVLLFSVVPMLVVFCIVTIFSVTTIISMGKERIKAYRNEIMNERKDWVGNYTELALETISGLPRKQALMQIRKMHYGDHGYFWVNDFDCFMLTHPDPKLDRKDASNLKDPSGIYIVREAVKVCKEKGEGFISYSWKAPNDERLQPKLSYVKLIKKWNWVIGTGIYINDIDEMVMKEQAKIRKGTNLLVLKVVLISAIAVLVIGLIISRLTVRLVDRPVRQISDTIKDFNNDLTKKIAVESRNEIGELAFWFNSYTDKLHSVVKRVSDAVMGINSYASEISSAVEQQATTAAQQSAAVAEITSTMEELSASSMQIADHSNSVVDIATKTWEDTKRGATAVESVIIKMNEIHQDNENSIREIVDLGRKSKEITKIMEIINTVADQTKLIAFNAALEASSAGESGKRFGVVAVEIRRLADSVMESTEEIEGKINEIQEAINRLVVASEKGSKGVQEGMEYSNQTATLLSDMVDAAQATTNAAKQISLSTQQQKTASSQVVGALKEIVSGSGQISDSIGQISSISKEMAMLSDNLKEMVEKFKLKDTE